MRKKWKREERKSERSLEKEKERGESIRRVRDQRRTQEHNQPPFPRTRGKGVEWFHENESLERRKTFFSLPKLSNISFIIFGVYGSFLKMITLCLL
jgi:hypothetical protein